MGHFGLLSSGKLVLKNATDFIGPFLGESEERTKGIIKDAKGKVLMIDEAYMLDPYRTSNELGADSYRQAVIDTLVGEVQNSPGEDICVIMCGYKQEMELMIRRANPGLARRFPIADAFVFEEFDVHQLEKVLERKMETEVGCTMTPEAKSLAMQMLSFAKQQPNFGNGGEVDNLLGRAMGNFRMRFSEIPPEDQSGNVCFQSEDLDPTLKKSFKVEDQIDTLFAGLVGMQDLKNSFRELARRSTSLRLNGRNPMKFMPFHFVFKGTDNTGKKTVAKKLSWLYHTMRLLPTNQVVETSARELLVETLPRDFGRALPGKSSKVQEMMESAIGSVLFIDGAHLLAGSINDQTEPTVRNIRAEFIKTVNKPRYLGRMVVILAGNETSMDRILSEHRGFADRFRIHMQFHPLTVDACYDTLQEKLRAEDISVVVMAEEEQEIKKVFGALSQFKQWASANEIQEVTNQLVGDVFGKEICENCQPSITGSEILQVLRAQYPQLSRAAENLCRFDEDRQRLSHIVTERKAQEAVKVERYHAEASLVSQNLSDSFEYSEPLKGRYIRVLRLLPADCYHDLIRCDLEVIYLDNSPEKRYAFTAVSYVCGPQNRTQSISCNGKKFLTTRNSEIVLRNLRQKEGPCTLWIDSICINQQSTPERNEQVLLMGHIFQKAKQVYVWLGIGSPETHEALSRFQKLSSIQGESDEPESIPSKSYQDITIVFADRTSSGIKRLYCLTRSDEKPMVAKIVDFPGICGGSQARTCHGTCAYPLGRLL